MKPFTILLGTVEFTRGWREFAFILRTVSSGGIKPYFLPNYNAQPTFTNLFIDYRSLLKLITIKLNRNQKRSKTPVSHIKVVAWLRTDSDTWQVLIKYGPLVPGGGRRDHHRRTLTLSKRVSGLLEVTTLTSQKFWLSQQLGWKLEIGPSCKLLTCNILGNLLKIKILEFTAVWGPNDETHG